MDPIVRAESSELIMAATLFKQSTVEGLVHPAVLPRVAVQAPRMVLLGGPTTPR